MEYNLTKEERQALKNKVDMRRIAQLYLNLERRYTIPEIAEEVGLTPRQVAYLTSKEEFDEIYNEVLGDITTQVKKTVVHDMAAESLRDAYKRHKQLINSSKDAIALQAVKLIYDVVGVKKEDLGSDDRRALQRYQEEMAAGVQVNIFMDSLRQTAPQDQSVDGQFQVLEDGSESTDLENQESTPHTDPPQDHESDR